MLINLQNKYAWVGGGSSGLGEAIAHQLAESGATVTVVARNEDKLKLVTAALPVPCRQQHNYLVADFADFEAYKGIVAAFFEHNKIDILVNNTSGPKAGNVLTKNEQDYQQAFDLLFQTVQYTTALALPHMLQQQYGRIINLTSRTVKEPADNLALSNAIRAAVTTWGKTLANTVAKDNITVNNILTGNFDTERLHVLFEEQAKATGKSTEQVFADAAAAIPMKRLGRPEEMAALVTFLASEQASYITGTNMAIDGGLIRSL